MSYAAAQQEITTPITTGRLRAQLAARFELWKRQRWLGHGIMYQRDNHELLVTTQSMLRPTPSKFSRLAVVSF